MARIVSIDSDITFSLGDKWRSYAGVVIKLDDGSEIKFGIADQQNCCEEWGYLAPKDDVKDFIGAVLLSVKEVDTFPEGVAKYDWIDEELNHTWGELEWQGIEVQTNKGVLQFVVYNSHNGYYSHNTIFIDHEGKKEESHL